jgi:hypothetical protein
LKPVTGTKEKELKNKIKIGLRVLDCGDRGNCGPGLCPMADFVINDVKLNIAKSLDLSSTSSRYAFHSGACRNHYLYGNNNVSNARFEIFTAVTKKNVVF